MPTSNNNGSNRRFYDIVFDETDHSYLVDGRTTPSVTEILGYISGIEYKNVSPFILDQAAKRGTLIHQYCEYYDYGILPERIEVEIAGYVQAYIDFVRDYGCVWEQIESIVCSQDYGFAGIVDRAGIIDNQEVILDIKTIASPTKLNKFTVCAQTAAYAAARNEMRSIKPQRRFALYLKKDGGYALMDCDKYEAKYGVDGWAIFKSCLDFYKQMQQLKEAKPKGRKRK